MIITFSSMQTASYGTWESPITSDLIVSKGIGFMDLAIDSSDIYWTELRPMDNGRYVVVKHSENHENDDITPSPYNVRNKVHEYGGAPSLIKDGVIYFSHFADDKLYKQIGDEVSVITKEENLRYADLQLDAERKRIICVREDHRPETLESNNECKNEIVAVDLDSGTQTVLVTGNDFYANPRISPDGSTLAWMEWSHPNMPWDESSIWTAAFDENGLLREPKCIESGDEVSVQEPSWAPDGSLYFISDRTGWWNIYRATESGNEPVCKMDCEFSEPKWSFGNVSYTFLSDGSILCLSIQGGVFRLGTIAVGSSELQLIDQPYTEILKLTLIDDNHVLFIGASPTLKRGVIRMNIADGSYEVLKESSPIEIDEDFKSIGQAIEFPTANNLTAHAFYYAPKNPNFQAPEGETPPLIVMSHGGPTSMTRNCLSSGMQYWTSRGFAVVDVNYGGSTGYGRAYRERLTKTWGITDVQDCEAAAKYLVDQNLADPDRLAITGGSAGGYTTLCALAFTDTFSAGASHFGISSLEGLCDDTHKFESRYTYKLVGLYPEEIDLYRERSALFHCDKLSCPVIFFQGLEDKIVLPNQAEMMMEQLREKGIPCAYVPYEGEQHGFRKAENIKHSLETELYFYGKVFGFEPADDVEGIEIENLG